MTDLAGIRVITYIERDIERVVSAIRRSFNVHTEDSMDKSSQLAADQVGYRSVHFVCDIGSVRSALPELARYAGLGFEIQVRTVLQHAWAEIEHDRSYKFEGELPAHLKRRFHLVAGLLELADREFNVLTEEVDRYSDHVLRSARAGDLDIAINSPSVAQFLVQKLGGVSKWVHHETPHDGIVLEELKRFGVNSLADLNGLFTADFLKGVAGYRGEIPTIGVLRDAMLFNNIDRYFTKAWASSWNGWDEDSYELMISKYGPRKVRNLMDAYKLEIIREDEEADFGEHAPS
jgi:hypothetical protein